MPSVIADLVAALVDVGRGRDDDPAAAHPLGIDPHPRPRPAVGSAGQCAALLGRPDQAEQPAPRGRHGRDHRPGRAVGFTCGRSADAARAARRRDPHLPVRVRDGAGLVGPLVVPGVTSCLRCADLHRSDRDAAWPAVAAQLRDTVGSADRATVLATAALALNQVDRVIAAVRDGVELESRTATTVDARHHAGVRRQHRLDRGPPVVATSAVHC